MSKNPASPVPRSLPRSVPERYNAHSSNNDTPNEESPVTIHRSNRSTPLSQYGTPRSIPASPRVYGSVLSGGGGGGGNLLDKIETWGSPQGKYLPGNLGEKELSRVLESHLVIGNRNSMKINNNNNNTITTTSSSSAISITATSPINGLSPPFGSVSHSLMGGKVSFFSFTLSLSFSLFHIINKVDSMSFFLTYLFIFPSLGSITRDIYRWNEMRNSPPLKRTSSTPDLKSHLKISTPSAVTDSMTSPLDNAFQSTTSPPSPTLTASDLRQPGGFRRHFIRNQARARGRRPPLWITENFIDFLALYGRFANADYSTDSDADVDDLNYRNNRDRNSYINEEEVIVNGSADGDLNGFGKRGSKEDEGTENEQSPLLALSPAVPSSPVAGTSSKKIFFLLIKAFVGTGVLFLPKAFANGGLLFSVILMLVIGWFCLHCMILLVEVSVVIPGSFGEIGDVLYGKSMERLVTSSIVISQVDHFQFPIYIPY